MAFLCTMAGKVFDTLPAAIIFPWPVFILIVSFLAARRRVVEQHLLGRCRIPFWREVAGDAVSGITAGYAGSLVLLYLGITVSTEGFIYIPILSFMLMLIDLRYLCLAYAGGLLSLISLATGLPALHIPGLFALVAVLHFVESALILAGGDQRALPVYLRRPEGTVGGYLLQRVWPMPLLCLGITTAASTQSVVYLQSPSWWPLIPINLASGMIFMVFPAAVALGYGDLSLTSSPRVKAVRTAGLLGLYSVVLLALAVAAVRIPVCAWMAAFFAPCGHELVLFTARQIELHGKPAFAHMAAGVKVLAVMPGSRAATAGIRPGAVIAEVNGHPVESKADLLARLGESILLTTIVTRPPDGREERRIELRGDTTSIGLVLAPDLDEPAQVSIGPWRFLPWRRETVQ